MEKVTGIKSVDFKIKALGHGVVNWNGSTNLTKYDHVKNSYKNLTNHSMPKLRGYSNIREFDGNGNAKFYRQPEEVNFSKSKLYISQNCVRHHLFRGEPYNLQSPELLINPIKLLCSMVGMLRGYVIPKNENKRTSPLLLTDFVDQLGNGNYEQMGQSGSKEKKENKDGKESSNSIFSKTTFGDTQYVAYGSISIEQLQFVPLCSDFGRQALIVNNHSEGKKVAKTLTKYLRETFGDEGAEAIYHENYVRRGSIFDEGEQGVLLNDSAVDVLVSEMINLIQNLSIRQAKGYMYVEEVEVDYNDGFGKDMMRIKHSSEKVSPVKEKGYAVYYEGK